MGHDLDKSFEGILSRRSTPQAAPDLAERIIHHALVLAAEQKSKEQRGQGVSFWMDVVSMFVLPKPSYFVMAGIVMGLALGLLTGEAVFPLSGSADGLDWVSFLDVNEGAWL